MNKLSPDRQAQIIKVLSLSPLWPAQVFVVSHNLEILPFQSLSLLFYLNFPLMLSPDVVCYGLAFQEGSSVRFLGLF